MSAIRFELVTLFPECLDALRIGLLGRAIEDGLVEVHAENPRDHTQDKHRTTDDTPYGGGSGMVMKAPPVADALDALDAQRGGPTHRVLLTPQGTRFDQRVAERLAAEPCVTFVCGRYEGFDERIRGLVHEELSLGDFVLLGGEVAALTMIEASARLVPGVIGNEQSAVEESHAPSGLLEYPQYTRPAEFRGQGIPPILLSGHHAKIARWRRKQQILRTLERRPELLDPAKLSDEDRALLDEVRAELASADDHESDDA